jgi:Terminase large subunit, T4likevirus-type, N-terminal/Terminase RNaseH-like domain
MSDLPKIQLMEAQAEFLSDTTTKFLGFMGSYRAGKTRAGCYKAIYLASLNIGYNGMMTEPTMEMVATTLIPAMEESLASVGFVEGETYHCYRNNVNPHFQLIFPTGKVKIYLKASENWERIRGFDLAWFVADEFDTSKADICNQSWQKMVARLTKGNVKQGCITSTKEGFKWAYHYFVENPTKLKKEHEELVAAGKATGPYISDRRMIDVLVQDNPFIDEGYVEMQRKELSPKQFQAYIKNEFVNFTEGTVYYCYDRDDSLSKFTIDKIPKTELLHIGVDFNVGKMAAITAVINGRTDQAHVIDEFFGAQHTRALAAEIKKRYAGRYVQLYVDTSGNSEKTNADQTDIQILRESFGESSVVAYKKHLLVSERVGIVNARFLAADGKTRMLFVNNAACPILTKCLEGQGYDKSGKPDKDGDMDHLPDALGYFVSYKWPLKKGGGSVTVLNG